MRIILFSILLFPLSISAQEIIWQRTYGGAEDDFCFSARQTTDGGYVLAGMTRSFGLGPADMYLIKTDAEGNVLWSRTYGGDDFDAAMCVRQTKDKGYILVGYTSSYGAGDHDVYVVKTNAVGDTIWTRVFGGALCDHGKSLDLVGNSGYIVCGYTDSFGAGLADYYLIRLDPEGDSLWTRTYGDDITQYAYDVEYTNDGGFIIAGDDYTTHDVYLVKTDADGDTLWSQTIGVPGIELCNSVMQTFDSGYICAGLSNPLGSEEGILLARTDSLGNELWSLRYDTGQYDGLNDIDVTNEGDYIAAGYLWHPDYNPMDFLVIKADQDGNLIWVQTFGGDAIDEAQSIQVTSDGAFIIAGRTYSYGAGGADFWLLKVGDQTAVEELPPDCADCGSISSVFPNPFNSVTEIQYTLSDPQFVKLTVYDLIGRQVQVLLDQYEQAGVHAVTFNASDLSSGVYFYRLRAGNEVETKRMLLLK